MVLVLARTHNWGCRDLTHDQVVLQLELSACNYDMDTILCSPCPNVHVQAWLLYKMYMYVGPLESFLLYWMYMGLPFLVPSGGGGIWNINQEILFIKFASVMHPVSICCRRKANLIVNEGHSDVPTGNLRLYSWCVYFSILRTIIFLSQYQSLCY